MREILFRGKRVDNGKWVEGNLFVGDDGECEILIGTRTIRISYPVIPETVGQFTGLNDKNGRKIFEGDIVRTQEYYDRPYSAKAKQKRHIGVVEYTVYKFVDGLCYNVEWKVKIANYGKYHCWAWSEFYDCEVIGNIHDNPELLEDEE